MRTQRLFNMARTNNNHCCILVELSVALKMSPGLAEVHQGFLADKKFRHKTKRKYFHENKSC